MLISLVGNYQKGLIDKNFGCIFWKYNFELYVQKLFCILYIHISKSLFTIVCLITLTTKIDLRDGEEYICEEMNLEAGTFGSCCMNFEDVSSTCNDVGF